MRILIALATATLALPAIAQYPAASVNSSSTPPPASANIAITADPNGAASKPKVEVGYDAKVKRDPYGNIIKDDKKAAAKTEEAPALRNDKKLTGDSVLLKK